MSWHTYIGVVFPMYVCLFCKRLIALSVLSSDKKCEMVQCYKEKIGNTEFADLLREIIADQNYGATILMDSARLKSILSDLAPKNPNERNLICNVLSEGVGKELISVIGKSEEEQKRAINSCVYLIRENLSYVNDTKISVALVILCDAMGIDKELAEKTCDLIIGKKQERNAASGGAKKKKAENNTKIRLEKQSHGEKVQHPQPTSKPKPTPAPPPPIPPSPVVPQPKRNESAGLIKKMCLVGLCLIIGIGSIYLLKGHRSQTPLESEAVFEEVSASETKKSENGDESVNEGTVASVTSQITSEDYNQEVTSGIVESAVADESSAELSVVIIETEGQAELSVSSDDLNLTFEGITISVKEITDTVQVPQELVAATMTINNQTIKGWTKSGENQPEYFLFYGENDKNNSRLYCYDLNEKTIQRYFGVPFIEKADLSVNTEKKVTLSSKKSIITVLNLEENMMVPEGFIRKKVRIGDKEIEAWVEDNVSEYFYFYGKNEENGEHIYRYDTVEKTVQRYFEELNYLSDIENTETDPTVANSESTVETIGSTVSVVKETQSMPIESIGKEIQSADSEYRYVLSVDKDGNTSAASVSGMKAVKNIRIDNDYMVFTFVHNDGQSDYEEVVSCSQYYGRLPQKFTNSFSAEAEVFSYKLGGDNIYVDVFDEYGMVRITDSNGIESYFVKQGGLDINSVLGQDVSNALKVEDNDYTYLCTLKDGKYIIAEPEVCSISETVASGEQLESIIILDKEGNTKEYALEFINNTVHRYKSGIDTYVDAYLCDMDGISVAVDIKENQFICFYDNENRYGPYDGTRHYYSKEGVSGKLIESLGCSKSLFQ